MNSASYAAAAAAETARPIVPTRRKRDAARAWVPLIKPRIVSLVLFTAVVACFLASNGRPSGQILLVLLISGLLSTGGAAALNHWFDRDIDGLMSRTNNRPLINGQIAQTGVVPVGAAGMVILGVLLASAVNLQLAGFELLGALVYAAVYTVWLKRRTPLNIIIGGFAGSAAVLGGWAAVHPRLGLVPWLLAGLVFFWTPAHFWSLAVAKSGDYRQAGVPMLPLVVGPRAAAWWAQIHVLATVVLSIWIGQAAGFSPLYYAIAGAAGLFFLWAGVRLLRAPGPTPGWQLFKFSGPYLGLIFLSVLFEALLRSL